MQDDSAARKDAEKRKACLDDLPSSIRQSLQDARESQRQARRQQLLDDVPQQFKKSRSVQKTDMEAYFASGPSTLETRFLCEQRFSQARPPARS